MREQSCAIGNFAIFRDFRDFRDFYAIFRVFFTIFTIFFPLALAIARASRKIQVGKMTKIAKNAGVQQLKSPKIQAPCTCPSSPSRRTSSRCPSRRPEATTSTRSTTGTRRCCSTQGAAAVPRFRATSLKYAILVAAHLYFTRF